MRHILNTKHWLLLIIFWEEKCRRSPRAKLAFLGSSSLCLVCFFFYTFWQPLKHFIWRDINLWYQVIDIWQCSFLNYKKEHEFGNAINKTAERKRYSLHSCVYLIFCRNVMLACSAGVFFERAICSRERHVETSRREEEMGRVYLP